MAQQMRIHGCAQLRLYPRFPAEEVHRFACHGLGPIVAWEEPGAWFIPLPILPEQCQQPRREHDTAITPTFPLPDAEHHASTIDIGDLEVTEFRDAQAGSIEGHQNGTRFEAAGSLEQGRHFGLTIPNAKPPAMLEESRCFTYAEDLPECFDRSKPYQGDLPCRQTPRT